jgi:hypothetical protein
MEALAEVGSGKTHANETDGSMSAALCSYGTGQYPLPPD